MRIPDSSYVSTSTTTGRLLGEGQDAFVPAHESFARIVAVGERIYLWNDTRVLTVRRVVPDGLYYRLYGDVSEREAA
jgi:hypothetical protein